MSSSGSSPARPRDSSSPPPPDPRQVALHHARRLHDRKDLESQILASLVLLSDYPRVRDPSHSAATPAPSDADDFRAHVRLFQPSDYDDLIQERNANDLCGYVLCPNPRRNFGPGGPWKIMPSGQIARRKDMEMWCSSQCARRAFFVKVQLNETAAWERQGIPDLQIDLLTEEDASDSGPRQPSRDSGLAALDQQRRATQHAADLAVERGEPCPSTTNPPHPPRVKVALEEKRLQSSPSPAAPTSSSSAAATTTDADAIAQPALSPDSHLFIEGHKTQLPFRPKLGS